MKNPSFYSLRNPLNLSGCPLSSTRCARTSEDCLIRFTYLYPFFPSPLPPGDATPAQYCVSVLQGHVEIRIPAPTILIPRSLFAFFSILFFQRSSFTSRRTLVPSPNTNILPFFFPILLFPSVFSLRCRLSSPFSAPGFFPLC